MTDHETSSLYITMVVGPKSCIECGANFANNYRLFQHMRDLSHNKDEIASHVYGKLEKMMKECESLENIYF